MCCTRAAANTIRSAAANALSAARGSQRGRFALPGNPHKGKRWYELPFSVRKAFKRKRRVAHNAANDFMRIREAAFVDVYAPRAMLAYAEARRLGYARPNRLAYVVLAAYCLPLSGWRLKARTKKQELQNVTPGRASRSAYLKADELLQLPRIQQALDKKFADAGLPIEDCATIIAEIAHGRSMGTKRVPVGDKVEEIDIVPTPRDRLAAIDMRVRMTTGYAPTKATNLNLNARTDQFFEREVFNDVPQPALDPEEE